jgi:phosphate transport system substrate-binding protein
MNRTVKRSRVGMMALVVGMLIVAPAVWAAESGIVVDGSTTVGPIGDAFAEAFKAMHPDIAITVNKTGSGDGAAALIDGRCQIAMMSRFMKDTEFTKAVVNKVFPVAHAIAMDGVCIVLHPSNRVTELTRAQITKIYKGEITNWKELGGPDLAIVAISRDTSSGTYESFHELVINKEKMAASVEYVSSNPQAHARVKTTPGAIGYVGLGFVDASVKAIKLDGVMPTKATIAKGKYPASRPLFLFTNGYPKLGSIVHELCSFYLTEKGQEIIEAKGFIPVTSY